MPEWMTPLLWPVWWAPSWGSLSSRVRRRRGYASVRPRAVPSPTMPPPMTARSAFWLTGGRIPSRAALRTMVLGAVLGDEAHHRAGVLDVTVAPLVVGGHEEHVEAQAVRRDQAALDHPGDVALAAPDRVLARLRRAVGRAHVADAQADHRHRGGVREVAGQRLPPELAAAVEAVRTWGRLVGQHRPLGDLVVAAGGQRGVGRVLLDAAHGGATAGVDHAPDPGAPRRLEDIVGADHVVVQHRVPRGVGLDVGGQVHDRVDLVECGRDRVEIA